MCAEKKRLGLIVLNKLQLFRDKVRKYSQKLKRSYLLKPEGEFATELLQLQSRDILV